ncbi:hypothetical protein DBR06_SOUSAS3610031, partial [Sousa chinensis]
MRSQTVGGDLSAGSRREEGHAKPGRPSRAAGTKEADSPRQRMPAPAKARPAALLDRSPAPAARNKVYILLRPHPPSHPEPRISASSSPKLHSGPRAPPQPSSQHNKETDRPARVNSRGRASR